jgi:Putative auto-transporter adhesin, head GIN domain
MRDKLIPLPILVASLLVLAACTQGAGAVVDQSRDVASFSRIEAGAGVQVTVRIGPAAPMVVRAQENIQDKVTTGVRDGTLRIEANDDFTVADPVVVEVTVPVLEAVSLTGGAAIEVSDLAADAFEISLSGGARATISGTSRQVTLTARGGAVASLASLVAETVTVDMEGGSTAEVQASVAVNGTATGGAKLTVTGDGSLQVDASGGAEVHQG